jgi:hypothetical protein
MFDSNRTYVYRSKSYFIGGTITAVFFILNPNIHAETAFVGTIVLPLNRFFILKNHCQSQHSSTADHSGHPDLCYEIGLEICYLFSLLWRKADLNRKRTSKLLMHQFHGTGAYLPS